ncbi:MAG: TRAM domain-containing protein, partial [Desulfovibrio sp.]|nr:TRAM domain-containing protein [Desulfovibrio sp.]
MLDKNLLELEITALTHDGRGLARLKDVSKNSEQDSALVVFVKGALPSQKVLARVIKKQSRYLEAESVKILEPGVTIEAPCPHEECGGCPLAQLPSGEQLVWKEKLLQDNLERLAGFSKDELKSIVKTIKPSPIQNFYRNKMEFAIGQRDGEVTLGQRKRQSHEVIPTPHCQLAALGFAEI